MNKKKLTIIIVLAVIAVLLGILAWHQEIAKAPAISNASVPTNTVSTATAVQATSTASSSAPSVAVKITTGGKYSNGSFSFMYPTSWTIFAPKPLLMTDFNGQYRTGGVIPPGGAQISVVTTTISGNVDQIMETDLMSALNVQTSSVTVDGTVCAQANYQVDYVPGAVAQNVSIYCSRGNELWKIYFSYPANDLAEKTDLATLNGFLNSMTLRQ